jgi:hypothetical protein
MSAFANYSPQARDRAAEIFRGVTRFLAEHGESSLSEFTLKTGRRVDLIALDHQGIVTIIEIKSSLADYRSDKKWQEYRHFCDRFYFAVAIDFPTRKLPDTCGIIIADSFGASVLRKPLDTKINAARRKALTLNFARTSAARLLTYTDPDWVRS